MSWYPHGILQLQAHRQERRSGCLMQGHPPHRFQGRGLLFVKLILDLIFRYTWEFSWPSVVHAIKSVLT